MAIVLKENWGEITTQPATSETMKNIIHNLSILEKSHYTEIPTILRTLSVHDYTFIGSPLLYDLYRSFGHISRGYEGPITNCFNMACGYSLQVVQFLCPRGALLNADFHIASVNACWGRRTDVIEFLLKKYSTEMHNVPLLYIACNQKDFQTVRFLTETLHMKDAQPSDYKIVNLPSNNGFYQGRIPASWQKVTSGAIENSQNSLQSQIGSGALICAKNNFQDILIYILNTNLPLYTPYIREQIINYCILHNSIKPINFILARDKFVSRALLLKAIQVKNMDICLKFIQTADIVDYPRNDILTDDVKQYLTQPLKYAQDIGFTEFVEWAKSYIIDICDSKDITRINRILQQGFTKTDLLFYCCSWIPENIPIIETVINLCNMPRDKYQYLIANACTNSYVDLLSYLITNKKITALDIQKNDRYFIDIFRSKQNKRVECLKLLIEYCGGVEKLEISPQRLMRFCEENPNSETDGIKEYLCSLTGTRYAKKRPAPDEDDILSFIRETSENIEIKTSTNMETKQVIDMEISTEPEIQILKEKIVSKSEPISQELIAQKPNPPPFTEFEEHIMKKLQLSSEFSICFNMGVKTSSSICTRCGESFERQNYYTNICSSCDRRKMRKLQTVSDTVST